MNQSSLITIGNIIDNSQLFSVHRFAIAIGNRYQSSIVIDCGNIDYQFIVWLCLELCVTERGQELDYFDSRSLAVIVIESNNNRKFAVVFPQSGPLQ